MIIVVTGGIGSGKSCVCRILAAQYGFHVYEADHKVKELYRTHPSLLGDIEKELGVDLRDDEGIFIPSKLSEIIFADKTVLEKVEALVFPALKEDFHHWMEEYDDGLPFIFESATILEKHQFDGFGDMTVIINAPYALRLKRAGERDGDMLMVEARMAHQKLMNSFSDGVTDRRVDVVIENVGSEDELKLKVAEFVRNLGYNVNVT